MEPQVFISHSSKDKAIADAICKQLEGAGVLCWIAPRDIKAGSDWTEGIVQGIVSCRIFILVFSEHANSSEHVRREVAKAFSLGLAVIPFRTERIVPNSSLGYYLETVHWLDAIELPLQKHLDALTDRVKWLLTDEGSTSTEIGRPRTPKSSKRSRRARRIFAAAVIGALAMVCWLFIQKPHTSVPEISGKSIAVLPFENISANKDDTYFADGVQDEILNNLAKIAQLKVISRTSVMQYRGEPRHDLRQIAEALGVAHILEGTVRRDGQHVRVNTELIDARKDQTIWADSFDRDLTDIFTIQGEVAQTIAKKLAATLSPEEKRSIDAKLTDNLEAYDLYLQAKRAIANAAASLFIGYFEKPLIEAIHQLDQAIRLDPNFARAYCKLAEAHDLIYIAYDPTQARRDLGDAAIAKALQLQPDMPEVHLTFAYHLYDIYRDYERSRVQLAIARRGLPHNPEALSLEASMDRRQGRLEKAIQELDQAIAVDPRNTETILDLAYLFFMKRQLDQAGQMYDRAIDLAPDQPMFKVQKALYVTLFKTGNNSALRSALAALPPAMADNRGALSWRLSCALSDHDWNQATNLIRQMEPGNDDSNFTYSAVPVPVDCYLILLARAQGERTDTNPRFAEIREQLNQRFQASSGNAKLLSNLAVVDALLEKKTEAITEAKRAVEMLPVSKDAVEGPAVLTNLAAVYAWTNESESAFDLLETLVKMPNGLYYGNLKGDLYWEPLRKDERFAKLLVELAPKE
jgi:TolB-like protein/Tfp pilus assembly protein PilF